MGFGILAKWNLVIIGLGAFPAFAVCRSSAAYLGAIWAPVVLLAGAQVGGRRSVALGPCTCGHEVPQPPT